MTLSPVAHGKRGVATPLTVHLATFARHQTGAIFVTMLDFSTMTVLVKSFGTSAVLGTIVGATRRRGHELHPRARWIFSASLPGSSVRRQALRYAAVSGASLVLNATGEYLVHDCLGVQFREYARAIVAALGSASPGTSPCTATSSSPIAARPLPNPHGSPAHGASAPCEGPTPVTPMNAIRPPSHPEDQKIHLRTAIPGPKSHELVAEDAHIAPGLQGYAVQAGIAVESAVGSAVTDVDGNVLLDIIGGIGVNALGHSHPPRCASHMAVRPT